MREEGGLLILHKFSAPDGVTLHTNLHVDRCLLKSVVVKKQFSCLPAQAETFPLECCCSHCFPIRLRQTLRKIIQKTYSPAAQDLIFNGFPLSLFEDGDCRCSPLFIVHTLSFK